MYGKILLLSFLLIALSYNSIHSTYAETQTLTVYFNEDIKTVFVNGTSITNGTSINFEDGQIANITSVPKGNGVFLNHTYDDTATLDNPLYLTMDANYTLWAYAFSVPSVDIIWMLVIIAPMFALGFVTVLGVYIKKR
jgi:hypothetical protein